MLARTIKKIASAVAAGSQPPPPPKVVRKGARATKAIAKKEEDRLNLLIDPTYTRAKDEAAQAKEKAQKAQQSEKKKVAVKKQKRKVLAPNSGSAKTARERNVEKQMKKNIDATVERMAQQNAKELADKMAEEDRINRLIDPTYTREHAKAKLALESVQKSIRAKQELKKLRAEKRAADDEIGFAKNRSLNEQRRAAMAKDVQDAKDKAVIERMQLSVKAKQELKKLKDERDAAKRERDEAKKKLVVERLQKSVRAKQELKKLKEYKKAMDKSEQALIEYQAIEKRCKEIQRQNNELKKQEKIDRAELGEGDGGGPIKAASPYHAALKAFRAEHPLLNYAAARANFKHVWRLRAK